MDIDRDRVIQLVKRNVRDEDIDVKQEVIENCVDRAIKGIKFEISEKQIANSVTEAIKTANNYDIIDSDEYMSKPIEAENVPDISEMDSYK